MRLSRGIPALLMPVVLVAVAFSSTACIEQFNTVDVRIQSIPAQVATFNPALMPRLLGVVPNVGIETQSTEFRIDAVNLLPDRAVVVTFGSLQFNGMTNSNGSRIIDPTHPDGKFIAPPGTGSIDVDVFISGQNPPYLSIPNGFTYLPASTPALPEALTMTPKDSNELGGILMQMTGANVPMSANFQIVVTFQFSSGNIDLAATQTGNDAWEVTVPPVPAAQGFNSGTLNVPVRVVFADMTDPPNFPVAIFSPLPDDPVDGNPYQYLHSGTTILPPPQEFVIASGLSAPNQQNTPDSFVRTVQIFDRDDDSLTTVQGLTSRYMFNGVSVMSPSGTHFYPSPVMNSGVSFRDANSTFAHFALPVFDRTYDPEPGQGRAPLPPVTKPVSGKLFYHTNNETTGGFGTNDGFFAAYSNGEVEIFNVGGGSIHKQVHLHERFMIHPYFAVAHRGTTQRIFVARCDGEPFVASSNNTNEINLANVTGEVKQLSLKFAGEYLYFATTTGNVYRTAVDSATAGVAPQAVAMNWPGGAVHTFVADEFSLSGNGTTICFIAGNGNVYRENVNTQGWSAHNVFAIQNAHQGNTNITAVTNFANPKQLVFWDSGSNLTYGSGNVENGSNHRRIYINGVNAFQAGSGGTNLPGSDIVVSHDGTMCAFVTREDRNEMDGSNPPFIVYYVYAARIGTPVNTVVRLNSVTDNSFGLQGAFHRDMIGVPSIFFPKKAPNEGMNRRLVFTVSSPNGPGALFNDQQIFTADFLFSGNDFGQISIFNRTQPSAAQPFEIDVASQVANYVGAFPSRGGHYLFVINADNGELLYLDLRDGVSAAPQNIRRAHDDEKIVLPRHGSASANHNTYLTSGFDPDPTGGTNLEHWGNQLQSLPGPGLPDFKSEWLMFVAEESTGSEDLYIVQMSSLTTQLPSKAINVTNISTPGVIRSITVSPDGNVLAVAKGANGYAESYRNSGAVDGDLYIVNDLTLTLGQNEQALTRSATHVQTTGNRVTRSMMWYQNPDRYTLYFGEGSSSTSGGANPVVRSFLRFSYIDLDRSNANAIGQIELIEPGGNTLTEGAVYIYNIGRKQ
jgi:hypothetical protein